MATRKVWIIEELEVDGKLAHRQSVQSYTEDETTGEWEWDKPTDRLTIEQQEEWDRVMKLLKNIKGEDLRHLACAQGLMDHCFNHVEKKKK